MIIIKNEDEKKDDEIYVDRDKIKKSLIRNTMKII